MSCVNTLRIKHFLVWHEQKSCLSRGTLRYTCKLVDVNCEFSDDYCDIECSLVWGILQIQDVHSECNKMQHSHKKFNSANYKWKEKVYRTLLAHRGPWRQSVSKKETDEAGQVTAMSISGNPPFPPPSPSKSERPLRTPDGLSFSIAHAWCWAGSQRQKGDLHGPPVGKFTLYGYHLGCP